MPQQTLTEFVEEMEKAGLLVRVTEEKRVDELPAVMEANPLTVEPDQIAAIKVSETWVNGERVWSTAAVG